MDIYGLKIYPRSFLFTTYILKVGESEVPVTIVRGDTASDFILEAILPEEITYGSHALTIKANENTSILNDQNQHNENETITNNETIINNETITNLAL